MAVALPGIKSGHYGADDLGSNRFQDADYLAVVGGHTPPIDVLRAEVQAVRFAADPPVPTAATRSWVPYAVRAPDGSSAGRSVPADPDPEVDAYVRWSEEATVRQAIGRGRPALKAQDRPLEVLLVTNQPFAGLPIDRLTTLEELGAPPARGRPSEATVRGRDRHHGARQADQIARIEVAIAELRDGGKRCSKAAIARLAKVNESTFYDNFELRALAEQAIADSRAAKTLGLRWHNKSPLSDRTPRVIAEPEGRMVSGEDQDPAA